MSRTRCLHGEFYQTFKEELISNLLKLLQQMEEEGTLPKSLYEANLNQTRIIQENKSTDQYFSRTKTQKIVNKILAPTMSMKNYRIVPWFSGVYPRHSSSILALENFMDSGDWWATVRGVGKSRARLSTQHIPDIHGWFNIQKSITVQSLLGIHQVLVPGPPLAQAPLVSQVPQSTLCIHRFASVESVNHTWLY